MTKSSDVDEALKASQERRVGHVSPRWLVLGTLFLLVAVNYMDRSVISIVGPAIKEEYQLSNTQLGLLQGLAFSLLYTLFGFPVARLAERRSRVAIISVALVVWSSFTMLCGLAQNFFQLVLFRAGVGIGESGCNPPAHSLIADYFTPERRAGAISIMALGIPFGVMIGAVSGGWIADHLNWRTAFLLLGAPGVALGLIIPFFLREPARGLSDPEALARRAGEEAPAIREVFARMSLLRSLKHYAGGTALATFANAGGSAFLAVYLVQQFELSYATIGIVVGVILAGGQAIGTAAGGLLTERLGARNAKWFALLPALALALSIPLVVVAYFSKSWHVAIALLFCSNLLHFYLSPTFAVMHNLLEPRMRATGVAVLLAVLNLVAGALGALLCGVLIDLLGKAIAAGQLPLLCSGSVSLSCGDPAGLGMKLALALFACVAFWGVAHMLLASRHIASDTDIALAAADRKEHAP